ncbi:MAG TPA: hypothetical protein VFX15_08805 [Actinomycetes bacterium]|nr:hypothetical protein [Actinomycetes bacterium]
MKATVEWKDPDMLYSLECSEEERKAFAKFGLWGEVWEAEIEFDAQGNITGGRFIKPK